MKNLVLKFFLLCTFAVCSAKCYGTHLRSAQLRVENQCNSRTYKVFLTIYTNTLSNTRVHGTISFGDGGEYTISDTSPTPRPDLGANVGIFTLELIHTYTTDGIYKINYYERDRSTGILNIPNSHDVPYSTFVMVNVNGWCNQSPVLGVAPLDRACKGVAFLHNPGAVDPNGDSISYELTTPSKDALSFVTDYSSPVARKFYTVFEAGNEAGNGPPTFDINTETGLLTWDAPGMQGEYNVAFKIIEWRRDASGKYVMITTTVRDMQIVVEDCLNNRPQLAVPADLCVEAGTLITAKIIGTDIDNNVVKVEFFSELFEGDASAFPATLSPDAVAFRLAPDEITFTWQTNCIHVRDQAYNIVIKITDDPPGNDEPSLVTFKSWNIRVIAPAPAWVKAEPDLVKRTADLEWNDYACQNAEKIEVWRRVGSFPFGVGVCEAGISRYRGYTMIKELNPAETTFNDTNEGRKLAMGATYCYRIVARFAAPAGGKSYVSEERCVGPILADAPVLTNVSVLTTDEANGSIEVKWLSPPDISKTQYPEPYEYEVYRAEGFNGEASIKKVSGRISNTSFVDEGINSKGNVYNYRIVLYSKTQNNSEFNAIDTSDVASGVFLTATPGQRKIRLSWEADVPWSNVIPDEPTHVLYRKKGDEPDSEFQLLKTIDVTEKGFLYTDSLLNDEDYFSYRVMTRGTYGNATLPTLLNNSQIVTLYPVNTLTPCSPALTIDQSDCKAKLSGVACADEAIQNNLTWMPNTGTGCRKDIEAYRVYRQDDQGNYVLLQQLDDLSWQDKNLTSFAYCYKVTSVDAQGNESTLSESACNDNCPYYELPNVFSPNGDGCNDLFTAYNSDALTTSGDCQPVEMQRCARFVKSVRIKIMSRWGRELYSFYADEGNARYVNWDGRDRNGDLLESGVYYYVADVRFDVHNEDQKARRLKGWVHLLR